MTSCGLWQPAVFGKTGTAIFLSKSQKPLCASVVDVPWRRRLTVIIPGFASATAFSKICGDG
jgi:hypothetical protein